MTDLIKDLSELRLNYQKGELHENQVDANPHAQFLNWFNHALEAQLPEPYAMSLATADAQGRPHVRTVLLRGAAENGTRCPRRRSTAGGRVCEKSVLLRAG